MATSTGSTEMNLADILNSIMDTSHTKDSESDSTFLTQLLERGVIQVLWGMNAIQGVSLFNKHWPKYSGWGCNEHDRTHIHYETTWQKFLLQQKLIRAWHTDKTHILDGSATYGETLILFHYQSCMLVCRFNPWPGSLVGILWIFTMVRALPMLSESMTNYWK